MMHGSDIYEQGRMDALMGLPADPARYDGWQDQSIYLDGYQDEQREQVAALTARLVGAAHRAVSS